MSRGIEPGTISRSVRGLASVLPGTDRPLAQLRIVVEQPRSLLAELGDRLLAPDGQLLLDFTAGALEEASDAVRPDDDRTSLVDEAHRLEDDERLEEAEATYRRALAERPDLAEAHFNLGNVLRGLGRLEAAEERFRVAIERDAMLAEAWYNLADLLEETDRLDEAAAALRRAVDIDPSYADAHFNLAHCLLALGHRDRAATHWRAYLALDPSSEWARIARDHLESLNKE